MFIFNDVVCVQWKNLETWKFHGFLSILYTQQIFFFLKLCYSGEQKEGSWEKSKLVKPCAYGYKSEDLCINLGPL